MIDIMKCANELEGLLRNYLKCHYTEFGAKANDNLSLYDWRTPIAFALGCKYGQSNFDPNVKETIDYFLGNEFKGNNISDIITNYSEYNFASQEDAYDYVEGTIRRLREILEG